MEQLTARQHEVLDFCSRYVLENHNFPTLLEISNYLGSNSTATARGHLDALAKKGFLQKRKNGSYKFLKLELILKERKQ